MSYYRRHVFVCENMRDNGEKCCAAEKIGDNPVRFLRNCLREHQAHGKGKVRVNHAGCFDRCQQGPVIVVYPDNVWYRYESEDDLQEIAHSHLLHGKVVHRLQLLEDT